MRFTRFAHEQQCCKCDLDGEEIPWKYYAEAIFVVNVIIIIAEVPV